MLRPSPIYVAERFAPLRTSLLELLSALREADWLRPTAAGEWTVKDVVAHLLGGDIGILSRRRDGFRPGGAIIDFQDLVKLVNRLNNEWVAAARRMSPRVLCDLLAHTGPQVEAYLASLDPDAIGEPVGWAGPEPAPVWLDTAREFTERWHHQQQIRDATGQPPLYDPYFLSPVLAAFVRALPRGFRHTEAPEGTVVRFEITGDAGGVWFVARSGGGWQLFVEVEPAPAASVRIPQDAAWRMFTKGLDEARARASATIEGDAALAAPVFRTVSIIG